MKTSFAALLSVAALVSTVAASPLGRLASRQSTESESTTIFDDGDSAISFDEGGWTHLTDQGNQWREGTESYTDNPSGAYRVDWPTSGSVYSLKIWSGKKNDRGPFSVALINGTELGTGNAYADAGEPTTSEITFQQDNIHIEDADAQLVVRNRASGDQKFIALDYIEFTSNSN